MNWKFLIFVVPLMSATLLFTSPARASSYEEALEAAQNLKNNGKFAEASAAYEKALSVAGITSEQSGRAMLGLAASQYAENKFQLTKQTLEKLLSSQDLSNSIKFQAHLALGQVHFSYGRWEEVKKENAAALDIPDITLEEKTTAQQSQAKTLINLQEYQEARLLLEELTANETLSAENRRTSQAQIGKMLLFEKKFPQARAALIKALAMPGGSAALEAEIQLSIGLSDYEAKDFESAQSELLKVLEMPSANIRPPWDGGRIGYNPGREAALRLHFAKLLPEDKNILKVMFIGSSLTYRGDLPGVVMQLADSSPADRPRIIAGDFLRMGTTIKTFWDAGEALGTARDLISAENWDAVVFETFNLNHNDLLQYGSLFAELIKAKHARTILYEAPLPQAKAYPDEFLKLHEDYLMLAKTVKSPLAPLLLAYMKLLGDKPTPEDFATVYADWIHPTPSGTYLAACCIYAALTGLSPVGLAPLSLPAEEAGKFQALAWAAYQEANPQTELTPVRSTGR